MQLSLNVLLKNLHHVSGAVLVVRECKRVQCTNQVGRSVSAEFFGVSHLCSGFLLALANALVKFFQLLAKGEGWLPAISANKAANGGLRSSAFLANLSLSQVATFLYFGNEQFPVHCVSIAQLRYWKVLMRYLFVAIFKNAH